MKKTLLLLFLLTLFSLQTYAQQCDLKISSSVAKPCEGQTITINATGIPTNATLQWRKNGVDIDKAIAANYSTNQVGSYEVKSISETLVTQNINNLIEAYESYFVSDKVGFLVGGGRNRILKTTDGGQTWKVIVAQPNSFYLSSIHFSDNKNGVAIGIGEIFFRTNDGGENWIEKKIGDKNIYGFASVFCTDAKTIWILENRGRDFNCSCNINIIQKSVDNGLTWTETDLSKQNYGSKLNKIYFVDAQNGWIVGEAGTFFLTTDGGKNWIRDDFLKSMLRGNLIAIKFIDKNTGWVASEEGKIFKSIDGGKNWQEVFSDGLFIRDMDFFNDKIGMALGGNSWIKTIDGGKTWQKIKTPSIGPDYWAISFLDEQSAVASGDAYSTKYNLLNCTSNTITINPKPAVPTLAWSNSDGKLTATTTTTLPQLTWLKGVDELKNITTATYQPTSSGTYSVRVTDANGCSEVSKTVEVTILSNDDHLNSSGINVYPNPSHNGRFKVSYTRFSNEIDANLQIIGLDGLPIHSQKMERQNNTFESDVNVNQLPTGIYFLQIISGEQKSVIKISITK